MNSSQQATGARRRTILVGTDGSDDGTRAVRYGARVALQTDASLLVVTVVDEGQFANTWGVAAALGDLEETAQRIVDDAVRETHEAGLPSSRVRAEVVAGSPGAMLADISQEAELLVVGRRSLSGVERMFVGSTSVAVADQAACPVVVVSAAATPDDPGAHGRLTVAVNSPRHAAQTLDWAFRAAQRRKAALTVVHAIGKQAPGVSVQVDDDLTEQVETMLASLRAQYPDVQVESVVEAGAPIHVLGDHSASSDLLVLGRPRPGLHVGGTLRALLAHSACPVVVVR